MPDIFNEDEKAILKLALTAIQVRSAAKAGDVERLKASEMQARRERMILRSIENELSKLTEVSSPDA